MGIINNIKKLFKSEPVKGTSKFSNDGSYYKAASTDRLKSDWISNSMNSTDAPNYELSVMRARSRDLVRNDPVASAVLDTFVTNVVGQGLTVQATIDAQALGVSEDKAVKIQKAAERIFCEWKPYADRANILNFDEYQRLVFNKILVDGEAIIIPTWKEDPRRSYGRCLSMVESEELDSNYTPNSRTVNGITFDTNGAPSKYWIKKYEKVGLGMAKTTKPTGISARDSVGRPNVLHIYETNRPNQTRGVPKLAPVLSKFEDLNEYLEAELVSARVSACLSIFIQKNDPIGAAQAMATGTEEGGDRLQDLEPGVINYLDIGESINVVDPKRNESLGAFVEVIMRTIGMSVGMPYELLMKDFSKTNYSSARAAMLEARRQFNFYRKWLAAKFCQPMYELVLEEAYLRGDLPITRMQYENKWNIIKKAEWVGAPFGQIDEMKETQASILRINSGLSTYAAELAGAGKDWQDVFSQRAREDEAAESLGLTLGLSTIQSKGETQSQADEKEDMDANTE